MILKNKKLRKICFSLLLFNGLGLLSLRVACIISKYRLLRSTSSPASSGLSGKAQPSPSKWTSGVYTALVQMHATRHTFLSECRKKVWELLKCQSLTRTSSSLLVWGLFPQTRTWSRILEAKTSSSFGRRTTNPSAAFCQSQNNSGKYPGIITVSVVIVRYLHRYL